jgi:hypothetical protein
MITREYSRASSRRDFIEEAPASPPSSMLAVGIGASRRRESTGATRAYLGRSTIASVVIAAASVRIKFMRKARFNVSGPGD